MPADVSSLDKAKWSNLMTRVVAYKYIYAARKAVYKYLLFFSPAIPQNTQLQPVIYSIKDNAQVQRNVRCVAS